jgi:hypothetical protein
MRRFKNWIQVYLRDGQTIRELGKATNEEDINFLKGYHTALQWVLGNQDIILSKHE